MAKGGALPKGFERPSGLKLHQVTQVSQEKYEEVKPSSKTITLRISKFNPEKDHRSTFFRIYSTISEMDYCIRYNFGSKKSSGSFNRCTLFVPTSNMWFMWDDY